MGYRSTRACVVDLERHGHLVRIDAEIDPASRNRRGSAARLRRRRARPAVHARQGLCLSDASATCSAPSNGPVSSSATRSPPCAISSN